MCQHDLDLLRVIRRRMNYLTRTIASPGPPDQVALSRVEHEALVWLLHRAGVVEL